MNLVFTKQHMNSTPLDPIVVYTDGSCLNNGVASARGGIGVFFGDNDTRNISRAISNATTRSVASFLYEDIICRYEYSKELVSNNESVFIS